MNQNGKEHKTLTLSYSNERVRVEKKIRNLEQLSKEDLVILLKIIDYIREDVAQTMERAV